MNTPLVSCSNCMTPLMGDVFNRSDLTPCPACGRLLQVEIFPALFRRIEAGREGEAVIEETESSCFYHPQKKAVLPCDACGRFLCALCDCEVSGRHLCPACIEIGVTKGKMQNLENHRTLYDSLALTLAIVPTLLVFGACFTIFTSPLAIYLAIRHWNTPTSIVRRTKARHVLAIVFGVTTLAGWIAYVVFMRYTVTHSTPVRR
ncbi:MAG TPA: hypothetical protein VFB72_05430 [Verrucomicrobiae bacterium]|nr:hypothetical protein [Verrucomicrobiae bacterium]